MCKQRKGVEPKMRRRKLRSGVNWQEALNQNKKKHISSRRKKGQGVYLSQKMESSQGQYQQEHMEGKRLNEQDVMGT